MIKKVIILHDVDGRIYFDGIKKLKDESQIENIYYCESIVFKRLIKSILYRNITLDKMKAFWKNLLFRFKVPFIRNEIIILGMAPYNIRFLWYGLLAKKNTVIYHTSWPYWWSDNVPCKTPLLNSFLKNNFINYFNKYNFYYCGISKASIDSLGQNIKRKNRIFNIPHAIDLRIFKEKENKNIILGDDDKVKIIFVGRLVKEKGIYELISLAKKLGDKFEFTFIGDGELLGHLNDEAKEVKNINVMGRINDKNIIANMISNSDVFILPSRYKKGWEELFGISIIEAMACGVIVISTKHIGPREIISDKVDGFLFDDDEMLVENIYSFLVDINFQSEYIGLVRKNAKQRANDYSVDSVSQLWNVLLEKK